jgi:hypothetical protein
LLSAPTAEPAKKFLGCDADCLGDVHGLREIETTLDGLVLADETLRSIKTLAQRRLAQAGLRSRLDQQLNESAVVLVMAG